MRCSMLGSVWRAAVPFTVMVTIASSPSPSAFAQEQEPARRMQIEEVVVTAQRRAESQQSVAIAISAFSEEDLSSRRIDGLGSLANRTPGFAIGEFMPTQPQVYIRGIGSNDDGPAADPSTAVFVDEVYVGRAAGWTANLFDLERVEVLRGPQGTLYGKNVVGGAVNLISRKPDETFRAQLSTSVGNYNLREFQGLVSAPITDNLFGKVAYSRKARDGYLKTLVGDFPEAFPFKDPSQLGRFEQLNKNTEAVRANLRWLPSDDLEINVSVDNAKLDENAPGFVRRGDADDIRVAEGLIDDLKNRRVNLRSEPAVSRNETTGFMARADYELGWSTLTSISAYRESDTLTTACCQAFDPRVLALSPTAVAGATIGTNLGGGNQQDESAEQFSQEFRLTSTTTGPVEWVGGLYYLRETAQRVETWDFGVARFDGVGGLEDLVSFSPPGLTDQDAKTESIAVYGQASWNITESLRLTAGARWTEDTKRQSVSTRAGGFLVAESFDLTAKDSWDEFTPKFVIDYQVSDEVFVYGLASKGFKSGGFQGSPPREINAAVPFRPETAWLYEAGVKTDLFDRRARINLAAFYTDYQDLQVFQLLVPEEFAGDEVQPSFLVAQNAADARVRGIELEVTLLPLPGLTISGSYAYLDATFTDFFAPTGFVLPTDADSADRTGKRLRNSPKHTGTLLVQFEQLLSGGSRLNYQLDWRYQARSFQDPNNQLAGSIPSYDLLDGRVSLMSADGQWEFSVFVENLLGEDYFVHGFPGGVPDGGTLTPGAPRMFGATLTWSM